MKKTTEPTLMDLFMAMKKDIFLSFNCHHLATIETYDGEKQTCTATINYKQKINDLSPEGKNTVKTLDYPILLDVPCIQLMGGTAGLDIPIKAGDQALIMFNDRDIDNWFSGSRKSVAATPRLHSFSDGIAVVGLRNLSNLNSEFDSDRVRLYNGGTQIHLSLDKIKIFNEIASLKELVGDLITVIKGLTTTNAVVGAPCAIDVVSQALLDSVKTDFEGLLE